jgi:transcriptional regulator with XRE-family HTH domain
MTQEDLADRAGLSPHFLSTLENDKRDPSVSTVQALAKALGVTPGDLLGGHAELSPDGVEAGKLYEALTETAQETVLATMRLLPKRR